MAERPAKRQRFVFRLLLTILLDLTNASDDSLGMANNVVVSVGGGHSKQDFNVPELFAVKSSQCMQTTLGGDWKESHEKRVSLLEVEVSDFEVYLEWLYTGHAVTLDALYNLGTTLVRLYLLGDFLIDDRFCNAVIDTLIRDSRAHYPWTIFLSEDIDYVRRKTVPGSRLRKVLVDLIIRDLSGDSHTLRFSNKGAWSHEVTAEVLARMVESKQVASQSFDAVKGPSNVQQAMGSAVEHPKDNKNKCADYHRHGEGYPKCS